MDDAHPRFEDDHCNSLLPEVKFSRRAFLATAASAGFAVSAGPVMAQQAIRTPADGLDAADAMIAVSGGSMPAYWAAPRGKKALAAIMVEPEIWGLHEYQRDMCRRLARAGYFAVSFNPYFRSGVDLVKESNIQNVLAAVNQLQDAQRMADLDSVVGWLEKQGRVNKRRIGITGMCMGGRTVWMFVAHSKKVRAGVAWYGVLASQPPARAASPIDVADQLHAPVLGLYAGADQGIPMDQVERMRAALLAFGKEKESQIHVYEGMPHGFHADYRPSYRKDAADDGWKRMLAWFRKHGV